MFGLLEVHVLILIGDGDTNAGLSSHADGPKGSESQWRSERGH